MTNATTIDMSPDAMISIVRELDAHREAMPDPNDCATAKTRAKAIADRQRVKGTRDSFAAAYRLMAAKARDHDAALTALRAAQKALRAATAALDADVAAGRVASQEKRQQTLMVGFAEGRLLGAQAAVEHAQAVVAERVASLGEAQRRFALAVRDVESLDTAS